MKTLNEAQSQLLMKKLLFEKCLFTRDENIETNDITLNIKKKDEIVENEPNTYKISLDITIFNGKENYKIELSLFGIFCINCDDKETADYILSTNTVAIMFPYVRSQITLISSQPGVVPLVLPPLNINKLLEKE